MVLEQITLLDLLVGKGGFIIADPFIIATAVQQGSGWIGALHKRVVIFLHRLGSSRGGVIKSTPLLTQPSGYFSSVTVGGVWKSGNLEILEFGDLGT